MNQTKQRIDELTTLINNWAHSYYVDNVSIVSDAIFDQHFQELEALIKSYPEYKPENDPTSKVLGKATGGFETLRHKVPMLSLKTETDYTEQATKDFVNKVRKDLNVEDVDIIAELKYDGLGIDLCYIHGKLQAAITRGDGEYGENVIANIKRYTDIPIVLAEAPDVMYVRGEIVMTRHEFKRINEARATRGEKLLANPRNAAAGMIRRVHQDGDLDVKLKLLVYQLIDPNGELMNIRTQSKALDYLATLGFSSGLTMITRSASELWKYHQIAQKGREGIDYDIDGVVYKLDRYYHQELLGFIAREPRWAVAHKFPPQEAVSVLEAIDVQVGRTGAITPVARIKPVYVGGVTVSNVTLHNVFDLRQRDVRVRDSIIVRRAGDVIPEIVKDPLYKRPVYHHNFKMVKTCPSCNYPVVREKGERKYYCTGGIHCDAQAKGLFSHFVARSAMRIDGVGEQLIQQLMDNHLLEDFSSFYKLTENDLLKLEGFESTKASKIINSINSSKKVELSKFIYALGIRHVGEETAKDIAKHFRTLESFLNASREDFQNVPSCGSITAHSVYQYLSDDDNIRIIRDMQESGVVVQDMQATGDKLSGLTFAVTGSFGNTSRDHIKNLILNNGAKYSSSVSKKTSYLIAGEGGGDKINQAAANGVKVLSLSQFIDLIK